MSTFQLFGLSVAFAFLVFALFARWFVAPWLATRSLREALYALLGIHALRFVGLSTLVPTVVGAELPREFSEPQAYGDLLAAILALVSIAALRAGWPLALLFAWIFNVEGTADLLLAFYNGSRLNIAERQLGPAWYLPTLIVPALLTSHFLIFLTLLRRAREKAHAPATVGAR